MRTLLLFALLLVAEVQATKRSSPLRPAKKIAPDGNTAGIYANSSITRSTGSATSLDTSISIPTINKPATVDGTKGGGDVATSVLTNREECTGEVTYTGALPVETIYLTVTEGYDVPVTAKNASITASDIYITPLPACLTSILPDEPPKNKSGAAPGAEMSPNIPHLTVAPSTYETMTGFAPIKTTTVPATTNAGNARPYNTATVIVTKKTPAPTMVDSPTKPPGFGSPSQGIIGPTGTRQGNAGGTSIPSGNGGSGGGGNNSGTGGGYNSPGNNGGTTGTGGGGTNGNGGSGSASGGSGTGNTGGSNPANNAGGSSNGGSGGSNGAGNANNGGSGAVITRPPSDAPVVIPVVTTVDNVGVTVLPSSVAIGSTTIPIPTDGSPVTIRVDGKTFTVGPSQIAAPGTTIAIVPGTANQGQVITQAPAPVTQAPSTITAAPGVVIAVGSSTAVIAGTTYRVGEGAKSTTITVSGQTISIGPSGVGLSSTTIAAAGPKTGSAAAYVITTADGVTISVGTANVIISGSTYSIGSSAPTITTVIGGHTISIGPSGVGIASTTIPPATTVSTSKPKATASNSGAAATTTGSDESANAATGRYGRTIPVAELLGWLLGTCVMSAVLL